MSETILQTAMADPGLTTVDGRRYPLRGARIAARAEGGIALSTLTQQFENPYDEPLEVEYTLPLPVDGAVLGFTIRMGDRVIRSEVENRERAEKAYRDALFQGRTAGLIEQVRPDTFSQKLGNVPPRTPVEVAIEVIHPLAFLSGAAETVRPGWGEEPDEESTSDVSMGRAAQQWEYRFPTVAGVRYQGTPGQVPDAGLLSPDRDTDGAIPARFELALAIEGAVSAAPPVSPSHAIVATREEEAFQVGFDQGERLDRDVVVRWEAATPAVGVRAVEGRGLPGDEGRYALVTLVPPAAPRKTLARDLTVLIDASGSMSGQPLDLARRVVEAMLRSLGAGDRFELIAFASGVERLTRGLEEAGVRSLEQALKRLRALEAGGATDMVAGIAEAMRADRRGAQRQVILVTDGQIGFEHEVVSRVADEQDVRVHAVGVGAAVNRSLTQQAAFAGRGVELLVTDTADADRAAARLIAATAGPVLTQLRVEGSALRGEQVSRHHDLFAGRPLLFTAELAAAGGAIEFTGELAGEPWSHRIEVPPAGAQSPADPIAESEPASGSTGWKRTPLPLGALHGRALVAEYELGMDPADLRRRGSDRIERCALRHRIASSRTSLVAIAEEPSVDPRAPRRRERLAVELPAGVSAEGVGLCGGDRAMSFGPDFCQASMPHPGAMADTSYAPPSRMRLRRGPDDDGGAEALRKIREEVRKRIEEEERREAEDRRHRELLEHLKRRVAEASGRMARAWVRSHWLDRETLLFELPVPVEGMVLATRTLRLWIDDPHEPRTHELKIDRRHSTPPGEYPEGVILRIALCVPSELAIPSPVEAAIELFWEVPALEVGSIPIPMRIEIPGRPEDSEDGEMRER